MQLEQGLIKWQRLLNRAWQSQADQSDNLLSQNEFDYLACIYEAERAEPPETPGEHDDSSHLSAVAEQMQVRKSSASLMINKLEKRGFIERVTCRYDARAQHILLTNEGRNVFYTMLDAVYGNAASKIKEKLGEEDAAKLLEIIARLD